MIRVRVLETILIFPCQEQAISTQRRIQFDRKNGREANK